MDKRDRVYYFERLSVRLSVRWPICRASVGQEPLTTIFDTDYPQPESGLPLSGHVAKGQDQTYVLYPISVVRFI